MLPNIDARVIHALCTIVIIFGLGCTSTEGADPGGDSAGAQSGEDYWKAEVGSLTEGDTTVTVTITNNDKQEPLWVDPTSFTLVDSAAQIEISLKSSESDKVQVFTLNTKEMSFTLDEGLPFGVYRLQFSHGFGSVEPTQIAETTSDIVPAVDLSGLKVGASVYEKRPADDWITLTIEYPEQPKWRLSVTTITLYQCYSSICGPEESHLVGEGDVTPEHTQLDMSIHFSGLYLVSMTVDHMVLPSGIHRSIAIGSREVSINCPSIPAQGRANCTAK
jgi:hypothetical protein